MKLFKSKRYILPLFITILSLFMGVCYATVNGTMLDLFGMAEAIVLEEIYISDIDNDDNVIINNYDGTLLNSKVVLDDTDIESTKTLEITLSNNTKSKQYFEEVRYQINDITYDNSNIDFILDGLEKGDEISSKESVTFNITFKYSEEYKNYIKDNPEVTLDNELNSILNFYFGYFVKFYKGYGDIKPDNYYLPSNSTYLPELNCDIPKREGYIFMGWFDNSNYLNGQKFYDKDGNPTLLNKLVINSYEVTLHARWEKESFIPDAYQEVEYIKSTGTQFIDTGVVPTVMPKIIVKNFKMESTGDLDYGFMLNPTNGSLVFNISGGNDYVRFGTSSGAGTIKTWLNGNNAQTQFNKLYNNGIGVDEWIISKTMSINGEDIVSYSGYDFSSNKQSIVLIRGRNIPSTSFGEVLIYDDDKLLRDLIPCFRKEDGEVGMYDLVTREFYTNKGTNSFVMGPESFSKIDNYSPLEYIKSTGNQYIDTGVVPTVMPKIIVKNFKMESTGDLDYGFMLTPTNGSLVFNISGGTDYVRFGTSSGAETIKTWLNGNNAQTQFNKLYNSGIGVDEWVISQTMSINGEDIVSYSGYDFSSNKQSILLIRGRNIPNTSFGEVLIYDGDKLLRDLIPCSRKYDNEIGMYDLINDKFYTNQGTGTFATGTVEKTPITDYQEVEYIESTGTQFIDTGAIPMVMPKIVINDFKMKSTGDFDYGFMKIPMAGSLIFNINGTYEAGARDYVRFGTTSGGETIKTWLNNNNEQTQFDKLYNNGIGVDEWIITQTMSINGEDIVSYSGYDFSSNKQSIVLISGRNIPSTSFGKVLIYDDNKLLRELIPCYRKKNGEVGMYDLVESVFYTNQGSGSFIKGPDILN